MINPKRIMSMIHCDLIRSARDSIIVYIILSPILLALLAQFLLPSVISTNIDGFISPQVQEAIGAELSALGTMTVLKTRSEIEQGVAEQGSQFGLVIENGAYRILLIGNEGSRFENTLYTRLVQGILVGASSLESDVSAQGVDSILLRGYVLVFLILTTLLLGGVTAGMLIVEERAQGIFASTAISPLSISEYITAKSLLSSLIPLIMGFLVSYLVLGFSGSVLRYLLASLAVYPLGIVLGLLLGYFAASQIAALGVVKLIMPLFLSLPLVSLFIPQNLLPLLYIFPNFWAFKTLESLYLEGLAQFPRIALPASLSFATGLLLLIALVPVCARRWRLQ